MKLRAGEARDAAAIAAFQQAMAEETEGRRLDAEVLARGVDAALGDAHKGRYLVAEEDGEVVASLMLTREWSDWRAGWFWWIQSVYVVPERRGRGLYRALYDEVVRQARAAPGDEGPVVGLRLYVEEENLAAQAVYQRLGMGETDYLLYEIGL